MTSGRKRRIGAVGLGAVLIAGLAGCATSSGDAPTVAEKPIGAVDLSEVCPATIVIQTQWHPQAERGPLYQMLGDGYTIDAGTKSITGPLMAGSEYTGVDLEIRAGGPAIGFQAVPAQMYQDPSITLGYTTTDEAIQLSGDMPTVAVMTQMEKNPQMVMWDPATYPDVDSIASLSDALVENGGVLRYFEGTSYMDYLLDAGIVDESIVDGGYDGTPANFVASGGADGQQGFATSEAYVYEHEVDSWNRPVEFELVHDTGWEIYVQQIAVRADEREELSPCLAELVPVMQQAEVDFFTDPERAIDITLEQVDAFDSGQVYTREVAEYAVQTMRDLGIVGDGSDSVLGNFDPERVQQVFDLAVPLFVDAGSEPAVNLTADDLYTNEFIDQNISLGN